MEIIKHKTKKAARDAALEETEQVLHEWTDGKVRFVFRPGQGEPIIAPVRRAS